VIAGGAPIFFNSPQEVTNSGYRIADSVKVPGRWIDAQPGSPRGGTLVRDETGRMAVMAGGAPFWFASVEELHQAGYQGIPHTNVPQRWITFQPATPRDGTLLRSATSPEVWRIIGGRRSAVTPNPDDVVTTISPGSLSAIPVA
jgi:hypothetical protein